MNSKQTMMISAGAFALLGMAAPSYAQVAAATTTASTLEEVVVTANKREENLQKVSASVSSVNETTMQRQGVKEIFDLAKVIPEVTVVGGQLTQVAIRGIRTGASGPTTDSPNAVHIDGAYISRFTSIQGLFFDVQRVEVLAGPQGTLYGRNSAGGTLNIITNKPTQKYGASASIDYGNFNALNINAAVNLPLNDKMALRAAYFRNRHDGYVVDNGTADADQEAFRAAFKWTPTSQDTLLLTYDHENVGGRLPGPSATITNILKQPSILTNANGSVSLVAAGTPGSVIVPIKTAQDPWHLGQIYGAQDLSQQHTWGSGYMAQYDHDFGWANLTFQASMRDSYSRNRNGTTADFTQDPRLVSAGVIRPGGETLLTANAKWDSQELRLTSPSNQTLTYVVGLYRFHENSYDDHNISYNVTYPNTSAATLGQVVYSTPLTVNRDTINAQGLDDAYAAFGQATYTPEGLKQLHLTGGIRYNYEKKAGTGSSLNAGQIVIVPQLNAPPIDSRFNLHGSWSATTYKANVAYDITPTSMVYFDHSTGFKSGGYGFGPTPAYEPETIRAFEIGTKNRFFDNRLQVNVSAWHYDYKNYVSNVQTFVVDSTTGRFTGLLNTSNAAGIKVDGQSVAVNWLATNNDILAVNAAHTDAKYTSFDTSKTVAAVINVNPGLIGATGAMFNYSGAPVGTIPDWAFNATYDHLWDMWGGRFDAQVSVHGSRQAIDSGANSSPANVNAYFKGQLWTTGDLSLRYDPEGANWSITGYVRNVTNVNVVTAEGYTSNEPFLPVGDSRVTYAYQTKTYGAAPRTFGVIFSAQF